MIRAFDSQELKELVTEFSRPGIVAEIAILVGCLVAAWIVVRLIRGPTRPVGSVWFGNRIFDGVLFPVLALAFAYAARVALATTVKPAVFKVAIPILLSLAVIRSVPASCAGPSLACAGCASSSAAFRGWRGSRSFSGSSASRRWFSTRWTMSTGRSATRR
jgi:hypothetical protein